MVSKDAVRKGSRSGRWPGNLANSASEEEPALNFDGYGSFCLIGMTASARDHRMEKRKGMNDQTELLLCFIRQLCGSANGRAWKCPRAVLQTWLGTDADSTSGWSKTSRFLLRAREPAASCRSSIRRCG
jgi:hypothetical protein